MVPNRREFLTASMSAAVGALWQTPASPAGARRLDTIPFANAVGPPLGQLLGSGLDARLFTDLSRLDREAVVVPNEQFFIRTAYPDTLDPSAVWKIEVAGAVERPQTLRLADLEPLVAPAGTHLIECSGNSDPANYGLISTARWDGVPIAAVLDRAQPAASAPFVLVSGFDDTAHPSRTSSPGASWIVPRETLERARAFLALRMNGVPLPRHHGAPVRLIIPGWYGCACIKWVNRIELVSDDARPTSQMREFAQRTHQDGQPRLARDFAPATIDLAAMPVRIEKWAIGGRIAYKVIGIVWGGSKPTSALQIRFRSAGSWAAVDDCPLHDPTTTWTVWSHWWRPDAPGRYQIVLRCTDPTIRARRLDVYFYVREVEIDQV